MKSRCGRVLLCAGIAVGCFKLNAARHDRVLRAECDRIARAVEDYRAAFGRYPASLEEVGVAPDPTLFEFCDYGVSRDTDGAYLELENNEFLGRHRWDYDFRRRVWEDDFD